MKGTKELRKMNRQELLNLLLEATRENEALKEQNEMLSERLASREVLIGNAGSIAEASLQLSGIFGAAQEAADTYLLSLRKISAESEQILQRAREEAARIIKDAEEQSAAAPDEAGRRAEETGTESE